MRAELRAVAGQARRATQTDNRPGSDGRRRFAVNGGQRMIGQSQLDGPAIGRNRHLPRRRRRAELLRPRADPPCDGGRRIRHDRFQHRSRSARNRHEIAHRAATAAGDGQHHPMRRIVNSLNKIERRQGRIHACRLYGLRPKRRGPITAAFISRDRCCGKPERAHDRGFTEFWSARRVASRRTMRRRCCRLAARRRGCGFGRGGR